jgi:hypothetical protein
MSTINMVNPATPGITIHSRSGATYKADSNGSVVVNLIDVGDMLAAGFTVSAASAGFLFGGSSSGLFRPMGNLVAQVSNPGINPATTNADVVVAVAALPANCFDKAGRGIAIAARGTIVNNVNSKRAKIIVNPTAAVVGSAITGGTTIADTAAQTTIAGGWSLEAEVFKYGAADSNTQLALHRKAQIGATIAALLAPAALTAAENAQILVAVTLNAVTAASDISLGAFQVAAMD